MRYAELVKAPELDDILNLGAQKAHAKAGKTYRKVELAMGLYRK